MSEPRLPPAPPEWVPLADLPAWVAHQYHVPENVIGTDLILGVRHNELRHRVNGIKPSSEQPPLPPGFDAETFHDKIQRVFIDNWGAAETDWRRGTVGGWGPPGARERLLIEVEWCSVELFAPIRVRGWKRQAAVETPAESRQAEVIVHERWSFRQALVWLQFRDEHRTARAADPRVARRDGLYTHPITVTEKDGAVTRAYADRVEAPQHMAYTSARTALLDALKRGKVTAFRGEQRVPKDDWHRPGVTVSDYTPGWVYAAAVAWVGQRYKPQKCARLFERWKSHQIEARSWINAAEIAAWCARVQSPDTIKPDDRLVAATYEEILRAIRGKQFDADGRTRAWVLTEDTVLRLTPAVLGRLIATNSVAALIETYFSHLWLQAPLVEKWFEQMVIRKPVHLLPQSPEDPPRATVGEALPQNEKRPKPSEAAVKAWLDKRIAEWPDNLPAPSEAEDWTAARTHFGDGLRRDEFRDIRTKETPPRVANVGSSQALGAIEERCRELCEAATAELDRSIRRHRFAASRPPRRIRTQEPTMPPTLSEQAPPFALSIAAAVGATGNAVSRTRLFDLIRTGEVDARKIGRRTVVIADSLRAYIERQPRAAA